MIAENAKRLDELLAAIREQSFTAQVTADRVGLGPTAPCDVITVENAFKVAAQFVRPEETFPTDREQAALWRDLVLLAPMDLMVIFGGAHNDVVLLEKLKTWIEGKRAPQKSDA